MKIPTLWSPPPVPTRGSDLRALGVSTDKLAGELRRGTVVRLRRDVFIAAAAVPEDPRQLHLLRALAEQTALDDLVVSHGSAALAWDLPLPHGNATALGPPALTRSPAGHRRSGRTASATIHLAPLPSHHVTAGEHALRLTTRARTAVDIARDLPIPTALMVIDAALRAQCLDLTPSGCRRDLASPRLREAGLDPLREALAVRSRGGAAVAAALDLADPRRESPAESLSYGHMVEGALPLPIPQHPLHTVLGWLYPDFLWPAHRLIGEVDGALKYQTPDDMLREKQREQCLRDEGYGFVRWTGKEIWGSPQVFLDRIARALAACS